MKEHQYYDRRLIPCHKQRTNLRRELPNTKPSSVHVKRLIHPSNIEQQNMKIWPLYPILSNILVSKKLSPPKPSRLRAVMRQKDSDHLFHNFKVKQDCVQSRRRKEMLIQRLKQKRCKTSLWEQESPIRLNTQVEERRIESQIVSRNVKQIKKDVQMSKQIVPSIKFRICGTSNNEEMIRKLVLKRQQCKQICSGQGIADFKWLFHKGRHNYTKMSSFGRKQLVNHFQFNHQLCTKDSLIRNLHLYCQTKRVDLFRLTPLTFLIDFDNQYCEFNLKQFLSFFLKNDPRSTKSQYSSQLTFNLQGFMSHQNPDIKKRVGNYSKPIHFNCYYSTQNYLWLLKPTGLNRGRGIELFSTLQQLEQQLLAHFQAMQRKKSKHVLQSQRSSEMAQYSSYKSAVSGCKLKDQDDDLEEKGVNMEESDEQGDEKKVKLDTPLQFSNCQSYQLETCSFVIQKYVEKPLLIEKRKFDIRVFALLTHKMELFCFRDGYLRMAGVEYQVGDYHNPFIHLTNNAIQKQSPTYGQFEEGNHLPFASLKLSLSQTEVLTVWKRIKELTFMAFSSVKKKINLYNRKYCFEIFGLDFMVDSEKKVWLIEVNQNPCLECSSPLLAELIPIMLDGALRLTLDSTLARKGSLGCNVPDHWERLGELRANCHYLPRE